MNDLQIFTYEGTPVRAIEKEDGLWWVLKDVCGVVGIVDHIYGVATESDKDELSAQLAFLYLEKSDISDLSPAEFAEKYFEVKQDIYGVVSSRSSL